MNNEHNVLNSTDPIIQKEKRNVKSPVPSKDYICILDPNYENFDNGSFCS